MGQGLEGEDFVSDLLLRCACEMQQACVSGEKGIPPQLSTCYGQMCCLRYPFATWPQQRRPPCVIRRVHAWFAGLLSTCGSALCSALDLQGEDKSLQHPREPAWSDGGLGPLPSQMSVTVHLEQSWAVYIKLDTKKILCPQTWFWQWIFFKLYLSVSCFDVIINRKQSKNIRPIGST